MRFTGTSEMGGECELVICEHWESYLRSSSYLIVPLLHSVLKLYFSFNLRTSNLSSSGYCASHLFFTYHHGGENEHPWTVSDLNHPRISLHSEQALNQPHQDARYRGSTP